MPKHLLADQPDDDNPEWTVEDFQRAVRLESLPPVLQAKLRGRPKAAITKTRVTIRLDADVVTALKEDGPGWQTRVNQWLRERALG